MSEHRQIPSVSEIMKSSRQAQENAMLSDDTALVKETSSIYRTRRIKSEYALEKTLPWHFEKGVAYHVISRGTVDSLTFLRVILKQQIAEYVIISSLSAYVEDILEIGSWLEKGYIKRIEFFLGDIVNTPDHRAVRSELKKLCGKYNCEMKLIRNHSKVMVIFGERFNAVVESSANLNTNPRIEQTCITVDDELCRFYADFFNEEKTRKRRGDHVTKRTGNGYTEEEASK